MTQTTTNTLPVLFLAAVSSLAHHLDAQVEDHSAEWQQSTVLTLVQPDEGQLQQWEAQARAACAHRGSENSAAVIDRHGVHICTDKHGRKLKGPTL